ncbi:hypothetical protein [Liquorilactobacillus hordei]|uniref:Uncharacterized protein n=1 Tax=Liquorilactobacillus hordei DSM 19519 TaxID=1423759 RepID=A0A0R1MSW5_9LACO|nr:hypothetical protein [Liquorilactobacillus hordei]KRL08042.1 hypothetical protein FC92_GL001116 [Liquorilactobacillus hordei DSM 19519]QYH51014.1 hypothetical protein G6O70_00165 [Liquorilactobacillus hordei DSM 19519]
MLVEKTIHGVNGSYAEFDNVSCWYVQKERMSNSNNEQAMYKVDLNRHNLKDLSDDTPVYSGVNDYENFTGTPEYEDKKSLMKKVKEFLVRNNIDVNEHNIYLFAELVLMVCDIRDIEEFINNKLK